MKKGKYVAFHDDYPCKARLVRGFCPECQLYPDMQSKTLYLYCPDCDVRLKNFECPNCNQKFE